MLTKKPKEETQDALSELAQRIRSLIMNFSKDNGFIPDINFISSSENGVFGVEATVTIKGN